MCARAIGATQPCPSEVQLTFPDCAFCIIAAAVGGSSVPPLLPLNGTGGAASALLTLMPIAIALSLVTPHAISYPLMSLSSGSLCKSPLADHMRWWAVE